MFRPSPFLRTSFLLLLGLVFLGSPSAKAWSPYLELGTSLGKLSNYDPWFGASTTGSTSNLGFMGSFNFYMPMTSPKNIFHFEIGLQNRMHFVSTENPKSNLVYISNNFALRFELDRFFVGAGYTPFHLTSNSGLLSVKPSAVTNTYFIEGGVIWRVVPELQIVATMSMEYGLTEKTPSPASEYGLRFRFPLDPYSTVGDASSKFDGFRYPFGIMK